MAKPVFKISSTELAGIIELPTRIAIGYQLFDSGTLTKPILYSIHGITQDANKQPGNCFLTAPGSQLALAYSTFNRGFIGTVSLNPNLSSDFSEQIPFYDKGFVFTIGHGTGREFELINNDAKIIYHYTANSYRNYGVATKVSDNEVVSLLQYSYGDRAYLFYRHRINDANISQIHDYRVYDSSCNCGFLFRTNVRLYAYRSNRYFRIMSYEISNKSMSYLSQIDYGRYQTNIPSNEYEPESTEISKVFYVVRHDNTNSIVVYKYTLDMGQNKVTTNTCTLNLNGETIELDCNTQSFTSLAWISKLNDKYYLNFMVLTRYDYKPDVKYYKIYTFEIDSNDSTKLTLVAKQDVGARVGSVIFLNKDRTQIFAIGDDAFTFLFTGTEWKRVILGLGQIKHALYDSYGRLWILNKNNEVYLELPTIPNSIRYIWEKEEYKWDGTDIDTYFKLSAYNYLNERVSVTGDLKILTNNAQFDDGSRVKTVTTSATDDIKVNVKITGKGRVRVVFQYKYGA